jgi:hypothetical protein
VKVIHELSIPILGTSWKNKDYKCNNWQFVAVSAVNRSKNNEPIFSWSRKNDAIRWQREKRKTQLDYHFFYLKRRLFSLAWIQRTIDME